MTDESLSDKKIKQLSKEFNKICEEMIELSRKMGELI